MEQRKHGGVSIGSARAAVLDARRAAELQELESNVTPPKFEAHFAHKFDAKAAQAYAAVLGLEWGGNGPQTLTELVN